MTPLNPLGLNLQHTTLIEASAGTGKTYTITTLVVRLIAAGYPIESILVVTFTEAAAAELKLRIRTRLSRVLAGMDRIRAGRLKESSPDLPAGGESGRTEKGLGVGAAVCEALPDELIRFLADQGDPDQVCHRIRLALTCFDQACIMTIHAFCLQTLREHAFETGTAFDMELLADGTGFFRQVCMDFFMTRINDLDPLMLKMLAQKKLTPQSLARDMQSAVSRPGICLIPPCPGFDDVCGRYRQTVSQIRALLTDGRSRIADLILSDPGLDRRSYSKKNVPAWLKAAQLVCEMDGDNALFVMTEKGDTLYRFTRTCLTGKTKNKALPPAHRFFDLCQDLYDLYQILENNVICIRQDFVPFFDQALARLKQQQGQCFFDDLVNDLARALERGPAGRPLIQAVQNRYEACLIDEFQDTDPAQYRIFSTLFSKIPSRFGGTRPFFMIGDPKQAIYAFRGGDVFAYLAACRDSDQRFTLEKNFRSSPLLVQAVNDLFTAGPRPFVFDDIPFIRVGTPETAVHRLGDKNGPVAPLRFDFLPRTNLALDRQKRVTREAARRLIPSVLAREIQQDMAAGYLLSDRSCRRAPVTFGDMAVLVRTNRDAQDVQDALSQAGIPSYLSKTGSVFDSSQAVELNDILWAVFRPDHTGFMKAALVSSVFGFDMDRLKTLSPQALWQWQDRFRKWKQQWETRGFIAMIMDLLHSHEGLLRPDIAVTERGLTNFYHLVELISQAAVHRHLSLQYQLRWYQSQLFADTRAEAADELRLESDRRAVAIVTIHKSKGLEYPIVYLPYLWSDATAITGGPVMFHDPDDGYRLCLDLRGPGFHGADAAGLEKSLARQDLETRAEQRRLLYVAVTRASAMCRIFWGGISGADASALGSFIHPQGCAQDDIMISDLNSLAGPGQKIQVTLLAPPGPVQTAGHALAPPGVLTARTAIRPVRPVYQITSFSAVAAGPGGKGIKRDQQGAGGDEADLWESQARLFVPGLLRQPDPSGDTALPDRADTRIRLQAFPKGSGAGDFFHAVLEHMDFQWDQAAVTACVSQYLRRFGFADDAFVAPVAAAVQEMVATPLLSGSEGFCLRDLPMALRMTEVEFLFDGRQSNLMHPTRLFAGTDRWQNYARTLAHLDPGRLSGFVKGFIDLVIRHRGRYFLIDYKSNYLGDTYGEYDLPALTRAMTDHHYVLQYHIYTIALHQYLKLRLKSYDYEQDFGGVLYLFIRGMHPERPGSGVFFDRPPRAVVEKIIPGR
jgi:exodeoxyribonuclease V beta subunit